MAHRPQVVIPDYNEIVLIVMEHRKSNQFLPVHHMVRHALVQDHKMVVEQSLQS